MNGYRANIFEMQNKPGGCCTSWTRKGYAFDFCIHNLSATSASSKTRLVWDELGAFRGARTLAFKESVHVEDESGRALRLVADLDNVRQQMLSLAPNDRALIDEYIEGVRKLSGFDMFTMMLGGIGPKLSVLRYLASLNKWGKVNMQQYGERFQDPFLRRAFPVMQYGITEAPVLVQLVMYSAIIAGDNGWLVGGSSVLAKNIELRFVDLGGEISYGKKVEKILVKDNKAIGIRLADGSEHFADLVVSNADGHATIYDMLEGKYTNPTIHSYYNEWVPDKQEFGLEVFFGAARDVSVEPHAIALLLDEPFEVEGRKYDRLDIEIFKQEMGMAPEGKTVIKVVFPSRYQYWSELRKDKERYDAQKKAIADAVAKRLEKRFPGLGSQIEAVDVITPVTSERYLGAYRGLQSWAPKIGMQELMRDGVSKTLPGLDNFHMVGQYAFGMVGLMTAALGGRNLVKEICKADGKRFDTQTAEPPSRKV
jgi:phytoene dehydrogenase-like protein